MKFTEFNNEVYKCVRRCGFRYTATVKQLSVQDVGIDGTHYQVQPLNDTQNNQYMAIYNTDSPEVEHMTTGSDDTYYWIDDDTLQSINAK